MLAPAAVGVVVGLGAYGYELALRGLDAQSSPPVSDPRPSPPRRRSPTASRPRISTGCSSRACRTFAISPDSPDRARCCSSAPRDVVLDHRFSLSDAGRRRSRRSRARQSSSRRACGPGCGSSWRSCRTSRCSGFESGHLLHRDFQRLARGGRALAVAADDRLVETLRERKDAGELALIEAANGIATRALERTLPQIRVGMTELEVAGVLEKALRDEGSEGFPFPSIVASGPRSALPHARSSARRVEAGRLSAAGLRRRDGRLLLRRHAHVRRWARRRPSSARSTTSFAPPTRARRSGVRAGMTGRDADAIARDYIEQRGYGDLFGHSLGHGLGLEVHEAPRLARTADGALAEGAVVTIEPGIYRPGWGGVRIEDDVFLGAGGPRRSSRASRAS